MSSLAAELTGVTPAVLEEIERLPRRPVVFFDGVCGFCNWWVDFLLTRDRDGELMFAPLQGVTAEQLLTETERTELSSLVFWTATGAHRKTAAVVRILWRLPGIWPVLGTLLWLIPRPLRDWGYGVIARNRYRLAGKREACRMPTAAERSRFLP